MFKSLFEVLNAIGDKNVEFEERAIVFLTSLLVLIPLVVIILVTKGFVFFFFLIVFLIFKLIEISNPYVKSFLKDED